MNIETSDTGTRFVQVDISDSSEGATDAGNERSTATPCYRTNEAKVFWRGLAIVSVGVALGAGGELLGNYFAKERDGYLPLHTISYPQPLFGAVVGFYYGFVLACLNEGCRALYQTCLESRSISVASGQPNATTTQVGISDDQHPV